MVMSRVRLITTLLVALAIIPSALAKWEEIAVEVSVPPKLKLPPREKLLVAMFRANDHERLDIGAEIAEWIRRDLERKTELDVLDVPPPPIPEQRPENLAVNDIFWNQLGEDFGADIIVAGVAHFVIDDRSGFVTQDLQSPLTGQTIRRQVFQERRAFNLRVEVFFLKGDNGALLHHDIWNEERVVAAEGQEDLQNLFDLLDAMTPSLESVFITTSVREPRFIWVE